MISLIRVDRDSHLARPRAAASEARAAPAEAARREARAARNGSTSGRARGREAAAPGKLTWEGLVLGRLERFKRYPKRSRMRREEGVAWVRFALDRSGAVVEASLLQSSGHAALDEETLALVRRAAPLPKPPPEVMGDAIALEVPVEFSLRRR
jgi:periplasmic protein TonB